MGQGNKKLGPVESGPREGQEPGRQPRTRGVQALPKHAAEDTAPEGGEEPSLVLGDRRA